MAERRPPGFTVDLGFYSSREVLSIPKRYRAAAVGVWTLCGSWSSQKLSDGHVPAEVLIELGATPLLVDLLIRSTLWEPVVPGVSPLMERTKGRVRVGNVSGTCRDYVGTPSGIRFTNWTRWQRTKDEVTNYRAKEAERKRRERTHTDKPSSLDNTEMSARTTGGHPDMSARTGDGSANKIIEVVRAESRDPKTKTETETKKNSDYLPSEVTLGSTPNTQRGSRLPENWMPASDVVAQMRSDHPHIDLRAEHTKFVDYWQDQPGAKGRKIDWTGTWRNWIRRAAEQNPPRNHTQGNGVGKPTQKALGWDAATAELIAEMEQG